MERRAHREAGFTLIEIIVALSLTAILATAAGLGIVRGIEGYILAKETARLNQKAQLAMERMRREMVQAARMTTAASSSIVFTIPRGASPSGPRGIGLSAGEVKMSVGSAAWGTGDTLVDGVNSLTLTYYKQDGSAWTIADDYRELSTIRIDLALDHSIGGAAPFVLSAYVNPRNAGNPLSPPATTTTTTTSTTSTTTTSTTTTTSSTTTTTSTTSTTTTTTTTTTTLPPLPFWEYNCDTLDYATIMAGNPSSTRELNGMTGGSVSLSTAGYLSGTSGANNIILGSTSSYAVLYIDRPVRVRFHLDSNRDAHGKVIGLYANGTLLQTFTASRYTTAADGWNCDTGTVTGYEGTDNVAIRLQRLWSSDGDMYLDDPRVECAY